MELKYVGDLPSVSSRGVGFDQTHPDKYTYLTAAVELLEALSFGPTTTTNHLYNAQGKEYSSTELLDLLKKHCADIDGVFAAREKKTDALIEDLVKRVHANKIINEDERNAWLKNIELMRDYYTQYVTNESAYNCALDSLAQEIHHARIEEVTFPMFKNFGAVLNDLIRVLANRKPPIDAEITIEEKDKKFLGTLSTKHRT